MSKKLVGSGKPWVSNLLSEHVLLAIPIVVLLVTIAFMPHASKSFIGTIASKPEWYFLALVFCIEAHRDRAKVTSKGGGDDSVGMIFLAIAAVLSALAAATSVTSSSLPTAAATSVSAVSAPSGREEELPWLEMLTSQVQTPLQRFAIPAFFLSALWSFVSKRRLRVIEDEDADQLRVLTASNVRVYPLGRKNAVRNFYDAVASEYNKRNDKTKGIRNASDLVVQTVRSRATGRPAGQRLSVLDLGGGTGHNTYNLLRSVSNIDWVSVDISPGMTEKFTEAFPGIPAVTGDFQDLPSCLAGVKQTYDVIILCFSMSSMVDELDLGGLSRALNPGGAVIVADIHPGYIAKSPRFDIEIGAKIHALELRKVEPLVLEHQGREAGMLRTEWQIFENERSEIYSFVLQFESK